MRARWRPAALRFQTTAAASPKMATSAPKRALDQAKPTTSNGPRTQSRPDTPKPARTGYFNRKLRDISTQVRNSVAAAPAADVAEAVEILEEGISYLREVQAAEKIPEQLLYGLFEPIVADVLGKIAAGAATGDRTPGEVVEMLMVHHIAHGSNVLAMQTAELRAGPSVEAYAGVLLWWLRFLEYRKECGPMMGAVGFARGPYSAFDYRDMVNVTYFAYVMHCLHTETAYDVRDALKLLQTKEGRSVPESFQVRATLERLGLAGVLSHDTAWFDRRIRELSMQLMDPNGVAVARRLEQLLAGGNVGAVHSLFAQMRQASAANGMPLREATLNRSMKAYIEVHRFGDAVDIFRGMLAQGITPSANSWDLAIKAMGHPQNLPETQAQRDEVAASVDTTVRTMEASGVAVGARTLAVLVGCYANLNRQDLVAAALERYADVPVVHLARNNILIGLVINGDIAGAEAALKTHMAADASYRPSTGVINAFMAHYVAADKHDAVDGILAFMKEHAIEEDVGTITTVLHYYFKTFRSKGRVPNIDELMATFAAAGDKWDPLTLAALLDGLVKDGLNMDAARALYEYIGRVSPRHKHNPVMATSMMRAELEFGSLHVAEELFERYIKDMRNDARIWNMMITALLPRREQLALAYYQRFCEQRPLNVAPNHYTYYYLLDHFTKKGNKARVQWTLDEIAHAKLPELGSQLPRKIYRVRLEYNVDPALLKAVTP